MSLRLIASFIIVQFAIVCLIAQSTSEIDSLKIRLNSGELSIKEKVKTYFDLSKSLQLVNPTEGLLYADSAIALAQSKGWKFEESMGLNNKAGIIIFQGKLEEADSLLNKALNNREDSGLWVGLMGNILVNKANINFFSGQYDSALTYYSQSAKYSSLANDSSTLNKSLNNRAGVLFTQGKYQLAIIGYQQALKISEAMKDSAMLAQQYGNIGGIYLVTEQFDLAKEYNLKTLEIAKSNGNQYVESATLSNLSLLYIELNKLDTARLYGERSIQIKKNMDSERGLAISILNIARVNVKEKNYQDAESLYSEALGYFEKQGSSEGIVSATGGLSRVYLETNRRDKGINYLNEAINLAKENKLGNALKTVLFEVSTGFANISDYRNAFYYLKEHKKLSDSLFTNNNRKAINELRTIYESEKQKNEILNLKRVQEIGQLELERKNALIAKDQATIYGLMGGAFLLALVGGISFRSYQRKKKANILIRDQKLIVEEQKAVVEEKNKEITDSIAYAKRIQSAILPPLKLVRSYLENSFILYKPKDVVAGDFYWLATSASRYNSDQDQNHSMPEVIYFAAADCTGHGVPGAMVSVVCNNALNRSVKEFGLSDPGEILNNSRELVIKEFEKSEEEVQDGMDIALCSLEGRTLRYAGANNPLWIIRKGSFSEEELKDSKSMKSENGEHELLEVKAQKQPIGKYHHSKKFVTHQFELQTGDSIYLFSDGFVDQFGGENGKKFKSLNFKKLLLSIQDEKMDKQKEIIDETFENWREEIEQVDDVCVIGVRI